MLIRELVASGVSLERLPRALAPVRAVCGDRSLSAVFSGSRLRLVVWRGGEVGVRPADGAWDGSACGLQAVLALARVVRTVRDRLAEWARYRHPRPRRLHARRVVAPAAASSASTFGRVRPGIAGGRPEEKSTRATRPLVAVLGDFNPANATHRFTNDALAHAGLRYEWVPTEDVPPERPEDRLARYHGVFSAPASPYRSMAGALGAIRYVGERSVPLVGT